MISEFTNPLSPAILPPASFFKGVREINGSESATNSDSVKLLKVISDSTITFDSSLSKRFMCYVESIGNSIVTLAASGGRTITGTLMFNDGFAIIVFDEAANEYRVLNTGEANTVSNAGDASDGSGIVLPKVGIDIPIKRIRAAVGSGRFFEFDTYIEYSAQGELDVDAAAYVADTSMSGDAEAIDDWYCFLKGLPDSVSLRGTTWDQLSENLYTKINLGHIFLSDYNFGSGVTVQSFKGQNGTIAGGMAWTAAGFVFDGVDDSIATAAAAITSGEWWFLGGLINSAAGINEQYANQNNGLINRTSFLYYEAAGTVGAFRNDGSSHTALSPGSEVSASQRFYMTRCSNANGMQAFKDGSLTAMGSAPAALPGTIANTPFTYGRTTAGNFFSGTGIFGILGTGPILPSDAAKVKTAFNNIFGTSFV